MHIVYIKVRGKEEMVFPKCCYKQVDNFIVICTTEHFLEVGAFNLSVVEYVYRHEEKKKTREWFEKGVKISK